MTKNYKTFIKDNLFIFIVLAGALFFIGTRNIDLNNIGDEMALVVNEQAVSSSYEQFKFVAENSLFAASGCSKKCAAFAGGAQYTALRGGSCPTEFTPKSCGVTVYDDPYTTQQNEVCWGSQQTSMSTTSSFTFTKYDCGGNPAEANVYFSDGNFIAYEIDSNTDKMPSSLIAGRTVVGYDIYCCPSDSSLLTGCEVGAERCETDRLVEKCKYVPGLSVWDTVETCDYNEHCQLVSPGNYGCLSKTENCIATCEASDWSSCLQGLQTRLVWDTNGCVGGKEQCLKQVVDGVVGEYRDCPETVITTNAVCGNNVVESGEQCDKGPSGGVINDLLKCTSGCKQITTSGGVVDPNNPPITDSRVTFQVEIIDWPKTVVEPDTVVDVRAKVTNIGSVAGTKKVEATITSDTFLNDTGIISGLQAIGAEDVANCVGGSTNVDTVNLSLNPGESKEVTFLITVPLVCSLTGFGANDGFDIAAYAFSICSNEDPTRTLDRGVDSKFGSRKNIAVNSPSSLLNSACAGTCSDNERNGDETGVDCGGRCAREKNLVCPLDYLCKDNSDCGVGLVCDSGVCREPLDPDKVNCPMPNTFMGYKTGGVEGDVCVPKDCPYYDVEIGATVGQGLISKATETLLGEIDFGDKSVCCDPALKVEKSTTDSSLLGIGYSITTGTCEEPSKICSFFEDNGVDCKTGSLVVVGVAVLLLLLIMVALIGRR